MKARRTILGLIIFGGLLVLILGWAGVFSSRGKVEPVPANPNEGQEITGRGFRTEGENWSLTADEVSAGMDGERETLTKPVLTVTNVGKKEGQNLRLEADSGTFDRPAVPKEANSDGSDLPPAPEIISLKGNVKVILTGPKKAELKTDSIQVNNTEQTGSIDGPLDVIVSTKEGIQTLHARGAEFNVAQQKVKILSEITMNVTGVSIPLGVNVPAKTPAVETQSPLPSEPITVTCDGPCMADGVKHTVELTGNVVMQQGGNKLAADSVDLQLPESGAEPDRLVAKGNVIFKVGDAIGSGDLLVRTRAEGLLLLSGSPAVVKQGASEIRAGQIELDAVANRISVPVKGSLLFAPSEEGAQQMSIQWSKSLGFAPEAHTAVFRGDIIFARGDQTIQCQTLSVRMDDSNQQVKECFAEGDVRVTGKLVSEKKDEPAEPVVASSKSLTFYPDRNQAHLSGNASIQQGDRMVQGENIDLNQSTSSITVAGPGNMRGLGAEAQGEQSQMAVAWTGGMTYGGPATGKAVFQRDVTLDNGQQRMRSDTLNVQITRDNKMQGLEATGHVSIDAGDQKLTADKIASSGVDSQGAISGFVATGHVIVVNGKRKMRSERMEVYLNADQTLKSLVATGGTVALEETFEKGVYVAKGSKLDWNVTTGLGVLTGSPVELRQGNSRLYGDQVEFSNELGSLRIRSSRRIEGAIDTQQQKDIKDIY